MDTLTGTVGPLRTIKTWFHQTKNTGTLQSVGLQVIKVTSIHIYSFCFMIYFKTGYVPQGCRVFSPTTAVIGTKGLPRNVHYLSGFLNLNILTVEFNVI